MVSLYLDQEWHNLLLSSESLLLVIAVSLFDLIIYGYAAKQDPTTAR